MATEGKADIAVVGAGPAGLMAATIAARAGARVVLLEERSRTGGRLGLQVQPLQGPKSIYGGRDGVEFCRRLAEDAAWAGVQLVRDSRVSELRAAPSGPPGFRLSFVSTQGDRVLEARTVVLATGSSEPRPLFPGSALPGVMPSRDVQVTANVQGVLPGQHVLVVGSDNSGLLIASNLREPGAHVVAVVDDSPEVLGREVNVAPLRDADVLFLTSSTVVAANGTKVLESATVASVDSSASTIRGTERSFELDTICLAGVRTPESDLAVQVGCPLQASEIMGGPVPVHDQQMGTPVPGLYVCGDVAGVENGAVSLESGRLAGLWAARGLGHVHPRAASQESLARGRLAYLRRGRRGHLRREAKAALVSEYRRVPRMMAESSRG